MGKFFTNTTQLAEAQLPVGMTLTEVLEQLGNGRYETEYNDSDIKALFDLKYLPSMKSFRLQMIIYAKNAYKVVLIGGNRMIYQYIQYDMALDLLKDIRQIEITGLPDPTITERLIDWYTVLSAPDNEMVKASKTHPTWVLVEPVQPQVQTPKKTIKGAKKK